MESEHLTALIAYLEEHGPSPQSVVRDVFDWSGTRTRRVVLRGVYEGAIDRGTSTGSSGRGPRRKWVRLRGVDDSGPEPPEPPEPIDWRSTLSDHEAEWLQTFEDESRHVARRARSARAGAPTAEWVEVLPGLFVRAGEIVRVEMHSEPDVSGLVLRLRSGDVLSVSDAGQVEMLCHLLNLPAPQKPAVL